MSFQDTYLIVGISGWKQFLHNWFGNRYQIGLNEYRGYYLLDVKPGHECRIVQNLTEFEMMFWLQQHVKVSMEK